MSNNFSRNGPDCNIIPRLQDSPQLKAGVVDMLRNTPSCRAPSKPEMQHTNPTVKRRDYSDPRFDLDYSKIEERVLAQLHDDHESEMKAVASRAAEYVNGAATPDERRMRKAEVFGLFYNAGPDYFKEIRK